MAVEGRGDLTYLERIVIRRGHPRHIILGIVGFFGRYISFGVTIGFGRLALCLQVPFSEGW
jgi:hypothetical protein